MVRDLGQLPKYLRRVVEYKVSNPTGHCLATNGYVSGRDQVIFQWIWQGAEHATQYWSWWGNTQPMSSCGQTVAGNGWVAYINMAGIWMKVRTNLFVGLAVVAMLAVGAVGFATAQQSEGRPEPQVRPDRYPFKPSDPDRALPGTLSQEAVEKAKSERTLPVLWLGESFAGLNLTDASEVHAPLYPRIPDAPKDASLRILTLVYGECVPEPDATEPRCPVPLAITIAEEGQTPPPDKVQMRSDWSGLYEVRGLTALDTESGTVLWLEDGTTVTVHAPWEERPAVVEALASANHEAQGRDPIEPGDSLDKVQAR